MPLLYHSRMLALCTPILIIYGEEKFHACIWLKACVVYFRSRQLVVKSQVLIFIWFMQACRIYFFNKYHSSSLKNHIIREKIILFQALWHFYNNFKSKDIQPAILFNNVNKELKILSQFWTGVLKNKELHRIKKEFCFFSEILLRFHNSKRNI